MVKTIVFLMVALWVIGVGSGLAAEPATQASLSSKAVEKDGLSAALTVSKTTFAADEQPSFSVTFKNVSKKPMAFFDLEWYRNWTTRFEDEEKGGPWQVHSLIIFKRAAIVPWVCKPGETVEVKVDLGRDESVFEYEWAGIQHREVPLIKRLASGKYRLTVGVKLQERDAVPGAVYWKGPITTEPVEISISAVAGAGAIRRR